MDAKEASIFIAVLVTSIIILVLLAFFAITIIRHQRRSLRLYKAKVLAEITTLENERKRVSADLHDEIGPIVAGIKLKLNSLDTHNKEDAATLENIHRHITELINRMKGISNDLMPVLLLKKGLVSAMKRSVEEINQAGQVHIDFEEENIPVLSEEVSINLYRILQEIIHNCMKHSQASVLKIELRMNKNILVVTAEDNGTGFDYKTAAKEHTGLGLRNLLSRTEVLNGKMYVDSVTNKGTQYSFEVPLNQI